MNLTVKQDAFVKAYIQNSGNGTQAARTAGYEERSCNEIASENLRKPLIIAALAKHKEEIAIQYEITTASLIKELEEARLLALSIEQPAAATSATMGKAKLTGKDKLVIEHMGQLNHNHIQVEFISEAAIKDDE